MLCIKTRQFVLNTKGYITLSNEPELVYKSKNSMELSGVIEKVKSFEENDDSVDILLSYKNGSTFLKSD